MTWSHPDTKLHSRADCPRCGQNGYGHLTEFVGDQIGRQCLECNATWPIDVEPVKPEDQVPGELYFHKS